MKQIKLNYKYECSKVQFKCYVLFMFMVTLIKLQLLKAMGNFVVVEGTINSVALKSVKSISSRSKLLNSVFTLDRYYFLSVVYYSGAHQSPSPYLFFLNCRHAGKLTEKKLIYGD